ncbi:Variant surface glycoprotein [Trypanosoma congolense IL3000]|uniref:Variant surface glycoprotein n=1 Tax=Trypanosoma congolense (strain IL3000) TaxID=1068625 RepID=F9WJY8_TRYCI|nr:Variant surface glycoprotein [Trypanosoma congolense IL3000]
MSYSSKKWQSDYIPCRVVYRVCFRSVIVVSCGILFYMIIFILSLKTLIISTLLSLHIFYCDFYTACWIMIMKGVDVIMIIVFMVMGVHAEVEKVVLHTDGFDNLCGIMKSVTGLWNSAIEDYDFFEKMKDLGHKIDEIFFGPKWAGQLGGLLDLPYQFEGKGPKRSEVCGSNSNSSGVPLPKDSMVSAFLCLCAPTSNVENDFCGLQVKDIGKWSDNDDKNVKEVFKIVWGHGYGTGVIEMCEVKDGSFDNMKLEIQNLAGNLTELENTLKVKKGTLGKSGATCNGSSSCANVTAKPAWLDKLEEIKNLANITLATFEEQKKNIVPETKGTTSNSASVPTDTNKPTPTPEPTSPPVSVPKPAAEGPQVSFEHKEQEVRKALEEKPKWEHKRKTEEIQQKRAEDTVTVQGTNETSASFLKYHNWPLCAVLLI